MKLFLLFLVVLSCWGILHTYLIYPWLTIRKAKRVQDRKTSFQPYLSLDFIEANFPASSQTNPPPTTPDEEEKWPRVSVLMAVHNEAAVIREKMDSLLAQNYPGPYHIYVGSDNSTDATNQIITEYCQTDDRITLIPYQTRSGKPGIINALTQEAEAPSPDHVFLLTDASVMLSPSVVRQLASAFRVRKDLVMADGQMIHTGMREAGIGQSEELYISREVALKQAEGLLWGYTMGPFGGCYALRSDYYQPVPDNFLVDDFFLCLAAYAAGGRGISLPSAHCYEAVGQQIQEEFQRKVRISAGNWQNAKYFRSQWWPVDNRLAYLFFSHKILRWLTPYFLLIILLGSVAFALLSGNYWSTIVVLLLITALTIPPLLDYLLEKWWGLHWFPLRGWRYFLAMNLALLAGFFRYLKGISSNVWQPSKRH